MSSTVSTVRLSPPGEVRVRINALLGSADLTLDQIDLLQEGRILRLDRLAGEPLDVVVGREAIAQAEVVVIDEHFGLRITRVLRPQVSA